jgi:hypothetical protein
MFASKNAAAVLFIFTTLISLLLHFRGTNRGMWKGVRPAVLLAMFVSNALDSHKT